MSGLEKVRGLPRGKVFGWKVHSWQWRAMRCLEGGEPPGNVNHGNHSQITQICTNLYKSIQIWPKKTVQQYIHQEEILSDAWLNRRILQVLDGSCKVVVYNHRIRSIYHLYTRYILPSRDYIIPTTYHQNQNSPFTESSRWDVDGIFDMTHAKRLRTESDSWEYHLPPAHIV